MAKFFHKYSTPFITGLFLVSLITGLALFFHFGPREFHGIHEWLSLLLILPFALHIWKNWRAFITYFKRPPMAIALVASVMMSAVFFMPTGETQSAEGGRVNIRSVITMMENAPVQSMSGLVGMDADTFTAALKEKGLTITDPSAPVSEIASASGKDAMAVIGIISQLKQ